MTTDNLFTDADVISSYTRDEALADGELVDMTEWGSAEKGFLGGFKCPVAFTRALWTVVDIDAGGTRSHQSTRGRAHDVLWMASLALRSVLRKGRHDASFAVLLTNGRKRKAILRVVADGDGITIGYPSDF